MQVRHQYKASINTLAVHSASECSCDVWTQLKCLETNTQINVFLFSAGLSLHHVHKGLDSVCKLIESIASPFHSEDVAVAAAAKIVPANPNDLTIPL